MSAVIPNGLEYFLLGNWTPCTKRKYSLAGAKVRLSKIKYLRSKNKKHCKRKEVAYYYCLECMAHHLTSRAQ